MINAVRAVTRQYSPFILDGLVLGQRQYGRYDLGLIVTLVLVSNVSTQSLDDTLRFGEAIRGAPDETRRPISANSIALALGAPTETIRRQVEILCAREVLVRSPNGVIVPAAHLAEPGVAETFEAMVASFSRATARLLAAGFTWPNKPSSGVLAASGRPTPGPHAALDVLEMLLRVINVFLNRWGQIESALMLLAIMEHNLERVTADPVLHRKYAAVSDEAPPNYLRDPAPVSALAKRLNMPLATAHRRVKLLIDTGVAIRLPKGILIPADRKASDMPIIIDANQSEVFLRALITRLTAMGVSGDDFIRWSQDPEL